MKKTELTASFDHYTRRYQYDSQYFSVEWADPQLRVCLVVPVFDEDMKMLMSSLASCTGDTTNVLILLVFNNPIGSELTCKHQEQAAKWGGCTLENGLRVEAIKALHLPEKHAGVGLARKIGMDTALATFASIPHDGLIVCLDADCEVEPNYLQELLGAEGKEINGLSIYFEHRLSGLDDERKEQIILYEIWLRYYIQALRRIGYPHAFHTVGSSMAVRASVYARIGGMNRRKAGEDFYFLHKLIPQGNFYDLTSTSVYPSARNSERVPFGTGRAMIDMQVGRKDFIKVYNPEVFQQIEPLLRHAGEVLKGKVDYAGNPLIETIEKLGWKEEFSALDRRSGTVKALERNFTYWFNGFRMLKLVHWLRDEYYPDVPIKNSAFKVLNINCKDILTLINTLRQLDQNSPFGYF